MSFRWWSHKQKNDLFDLGFDFFIFYVIIIPSIGCALCELGLRIWRILGI